MNKQRGFVLVSLFALVAGSAFAVQDRQVTIESKDGKRVYKRVDHEGRIRLVRQLSDKPCREGRTWGSDRNGIWVDEGCRAIFSYNTKGGNDSGWNRPGTGFDTRKVKVESNGKRETRRIDTSGGVKLIKRLSDKPCIQGRTWGYDRNSIWVDNGCRAEFEVRSRNGNGGGDWWDGIGGNVPRWAVGNWTGGNRVRDYRLNVRSDGSFTLQRGRSAEQRGTIRGERVRIDKDEYRLERRGDNGITFIPIRSASGRWDFTKS